ncbi:MAG: hypothetical protein MJ115_02610 [Clostridia bacterium]|nr:hypothetical protein [Clostridia bacterium]
MKKLFNEDITPACEYCHYGRITPDNNSVLCEKRGIMLPTSSCKSFKYDVLKRRPQKKLQIFADYSAEDFTI